MIEKIKAEIEKILNSDDTSYRIAKETGIAVQIIDRYRQGKSKIENMTLKNAEKILKFGKKSDKNS